MPDEDVTMLKKAGVSEVYHPGTSREEIAKPFILLDACRLDLQKHESRLKGICKSFYSHISKHAYLEVYDFPNLHSMEDVKQIWKAETQKLWPGDCESGVPDLPHDTVFNREFPLYVDYSSYDATWFIPEDTDQQLFFQKNAKNGPVTKQKQIIESWKKAADIGLCTPGVLGIINSVFKECYISEQTPTSKIDKLYKKSASLIENNLGISQNTFLDSVLIQWPLYHFA